MTLLENGQHSGIAYAAAIDLTNYSSLTAVGTFSANNVASNGLYVFTAVNGVDYYPDKAVASKQIEGNGAATLTVDVSPLTGYHYIAFGLRYSSNTNTQFDITEVSLQ